MFLTRSLPATLAVAWLLVACGGGPATRPGSGPGFTPVPPPVPAPPAEPARPSLQSEQLRLSRLFEGTPVVFLMQPDGSLRAEVPLRYSFDPGSSTVKPPLAAVLDRLGTSQRGGKSRLLVVAPGDPKRAGNLATDRAGSARDYLVAKGIAATRFTISGVPEPDVVRIVVSEAGPPRLP